MFKYNWFEKTVKISIILESSRIIKITPNHQKGKKDMKEKFRLVIILLVLSKIFKKILFMHIFDYFEDILINNNIDFIKTIISNNVC